MAILRQLKAAPARRGRPGSIVRRHCGWWTLGLTFAVVAARNPAPDLLAGEVAAPEYRLKAAFLYNFAKLVDWPTNAFADPGSPIVIGVLGKDPFGSALDHTVHEKRIEQRKVGVKRFSQVTAVADCHLLFVSSSESNRLAIVLSHLADRPVLTVGEGDFAQRGGIIGLLKRGDTIELEINTNAAAHANLRLSSQLLRLATLVRTEYPDSAPIAAPATNSLIAHESPR